MAKRRSSRYQPGVRSPDWLKFAHRQSQTCVVGGWRPEKGSAKRIGALLVGAWGEDADGSRRLHYAGRVGSGITDAGQGDLRRLLAAAGAEESPFADAVPKADADGASWARPEVVVEVRHTGWTPGGRLRQPVFRGLRLDATPDAAALPPERVLRQPADEAGVG
jgi:bifunctional non-homologous end joining protein LigD